MVNEFMQHRSSYLSKPPRRSDIELTGRFVPAKEMPCPAFWDRRRWRQRLPGTTSPSQPDAVCCSRRNDVRNHTGIAFTSMRL